VHGWPAVHLTSDLLEVTVLPGKGADIYALTDLGSGIDPLFKALGAPAPRLAAAGRQRRRGIPGELPGRLAGAFPEHQ
jgi:hypothetical protein